MFVQSFPQQQKLVGDQPSTPEKWILGNPIGRCIVAVDRRMQGYKVGKGMNRNDRERW